MGIRLSELWWPWFKANVWSLLAGVVAFGLNDALKGWLVPDELGARIRVYPFFLVFAVAVYYAITAAAEWAYARRLFGQAGLDLAAGKVLKVVLLANAASYLVLGPLFVYHEFPRSEIAEFSPDSRWARRPGLTVLAVGAKGHLEASRVDGQTWRVVVPHEVRDYVVSGEGERLTIRDPAGRFSVGQAVFLVGGEEVLLELGGRVHLLDVAGRRLGPVMSGHSFIVLDPLFSKGADF